MLSFPVFLYLKSILIIVNVFSNTALIQPIPLWIPTAIVCYCRLMTIDFLLNSFHCNIVKNSAYLW